MSFEQALIHTLQFEGGYANDPADRGGETFRGISRKNWPHWGGWDLIDQAKRSGVVKPKEIDAGFRMDAEMEALVAGFYRDNFWKPFEVLGLLPLTTAKLFDTAVNVGVGQSVKFLQRVLNSMANAGLAVDGKAGVATRAAIKMVLPTPENDKKMAVAISGQQERFYRDIVARRPNQEKFLNGWLRRAAWLPE